WIRLQKEISLRRHRHVKRPTRRPLRRHGPRRPPVHSHYKRVFLRRIEVQRIDQPTLHGSSIGLPLQTLSFSPRRLQPAVPVRNLLPLADFSRPHFRRALERLLHHRRSTPVPRQRNIRHERIRRKILIACPRLRHRAARIHLRDHGLPVSNSRKRNRLRIARPCERIGGEFHVRCPVLRPAAA